MSEVDHAGHAISSVGWTTVVCTVRRSSTGMPDRLGCSSRNSLLTAFYIISLTCTSLVRLLVIIKPSIVTMVSVPSIRMVGTFVLVCRNYGSEVAALFSRSHG